MILNNHTFNLYIRSSMSHPRGRGPLSLLLLLPGAGPADRDKLWHNMNSRSSSAVRCLHQQRESETESTTRACMLGRSRQNRLCTVTVRFGSERTYGCVCYIDNAAQGSAPTATVSWFYNRGDFPPCTAEAGALPVRPLQSAAG